MSKKIEEHDIVQSKKDIIRDGERIVKKDDSGCVVHVYNDGESFEVEFENCMPVTLQKNEIYK